MGADLVIRNGLVVDGTGAPSRHGDVVIEGDRIVAVEERYDGPAIRSLDADGHVVTPGLVDIHTHLDAQLAWDPLPTSSCWHGVSSVVLGNCGMTFAPVRANDREVLAEMMESVEDIPRDAILDGLPWDWSTYGEYLGWLERIAKGLNVGGMVGHCAVRVAAMGVRSLDEAAASPDDIATITELLDEAIGSGALGFSTSRTLLHRAPDGRPVPGTWATPEELLAIGDVLGRHRRGVFEAVARLGERDTEELPNTRAEIGVDGRALAPVGPPADLRPDAVGPTAWPVRAGRRSLPRRRTPAARTSARRRQRAASACCSHSPTARPSTGPPRAEICTTSRSGRSSPCWPIRPAAPN